MNDPLNNMHPSNTVDQKLFRFCALTLDDLATIAGRTPAYIYSRKLIEQQISHTRSCLPKNVSLHYSIKANPHPQTVSAVASQVDGLDVASHAEMLLALGTSTPSADISFSGPGKSDLELKAAIGAGIMIHVESANELDKLDMISKQLGKEPNLTLRINPDFTVRQSGMVMGGGPQPFGIDIEQIGKVLLTMKAKGLTCRGLHCYAGSQMLNAVLVAELQEKTLDMMMQIVNTHQLQAVSLNIGGGFGIPYFEKDKPLDLHYVGTRLTEKLQDITNNAGINRIIIELGRYLVAESGLYLARIIERKISRNKQFLILDGGMNHNLAASGNLGQVIRRNYPIQCLAYQYSALKETVSVVGPLCTPLDIVGADLQLPILQPGDLVAVLNSGAYGYSASPHQFLSHPQAQELLI